MPNDAEKISKYFAVNTLGEGGFRSEKGKIEINDNTPVIIIGLGGTGRDALVRVKSELHNRFVTNGASLPPHVALLSIDTDGTNARGVNNLKEDGNEQTNGTPLEDEEIYTLTGGAVISNFVQNRDLLDEHQREWLAPELIAVDTGDGAGGMRQYGRLLLFREIDNVISKIKSRFEAAYYGISDGRPCRNAQVVLISGISGGTGAGSFLDMLFILKEIMNREGYTGAKLSAYLFAPDVNADHVSEDATKEYIYRNGFASFKDLDYWLNMEHNQAIFVQKYSNDFTVDTRTWHSLKRPVDYCYFISGKTIDSSQPENPYDYALRVVAESIISYLSSTSDFSARSNLSNLARKVDNKLSTGVRFPVFRPYIAVGATQRSLKKDALINCILAFLWHKINNETFSRTPSKQDISRLFNYNAETIATTARSEANLTERDVKNEVPFSMFKNGVDPLDKCVEKVESAKKHTWGVIINTTLEQSFALISNSVREAFCDINRGPFYAHRLLLNVDNPNSGVLYNIEQILQQVDGKKAECIDRINGTQNSYGLEKLMHEARGTARQFNFINAGGDYNRYVKALINYYNSYRDMELYDMLYEKLTAFREKVKKLNNDVVDLFVKLLRSLDKVFKDNAGIQTRMTKNETSSQTVFTWDTVDYSAIAKKVNAYMSTIKADKQEAFAQQLLTALYSLASDTSFMTDHDPEKLNAKLVEVSEQYFNNLLAISLQQQLAEELNVEFDPDADLQANPNANSEFVNAVERFVDTLISQSKPLFPVHSSATFYGIDSEFIKFFQVTCPRNALFIKKGLQNAKASGKTLDIIESADDTKIFFQTIYGGVPAYAYADIGKCAQYYDNAKPAQGLYKSGAHLRMSTKEDWSKYPCPIPKGAWEKYAYSSEDDASRIQKTTELMNEVWDRGLFCVKQDQQAGRVVQSVYLRTNVTQLEAEDHRENAWTGDAGAWGANTLSVAIDAMTGITNDYPIKLHKFPIINAEVVLKDEHNADKKFYLNSSDEELNNAGVTQLQVLREESILCAQQFPGLNEILSKALETFKATAAIPMFINAYCCDFIKKQSGFWILAKEGILVKLFSVGATSTDQKEGDYKLVYGQLAENNNLYCDIMNAMKYQLNKPENAQIRVHFSTYFTNIEALMTQGNTEMVAFFEETYMVRLDKLIDNVTSFIRALDEKYQSTLNRTEIENKCVNCLNSILKEATKMRRQFTLILQNGAQGEGAQAEDDLF